MNDVHGELVDEVDFTIIRYAQCWEDADVVLEALQVQPGDVCLSIASAGDNTLSLLAKNPSQLVAIDLSASQLACLELRVAAYRQLTHSELLELMGARPSNRRRELYGRLAPDLSPDSRKVWDAQPEAIDIGIGRAGKFEQYLDMIRRFAINLTHSRGQRNDLFLPKSRDERKNFYDDQWDNWRWRWLVKIACSRLVMGRLGRDPRFFKYAEGSVADHIMGMAEHALVDLDPLDNAYLHWIVNGEYGPLLPHALREENFELISANLDRLEWHLADVQSYLDQAPNASIHRFNFSDVFEYLSEEDSDRVFEQVARVGCSGGRLAYWNMLVPRHRPEKLHQSITPMPELSRRLHRAAGTFFYTGFVVEEIV
ncbi:MAG: BtaA family protein [Gammaproteobacteria bacterium]|nr:BtaA family protein [Gammaproteobacteria bacterium]